MLSFLLGFILGLGVMCKYGPKSKERRDDKRKENHEGDDKKHPTF